MPLSEKVRIEVYLPDLPRAAYQDLLGALDQELTHTFGGCTIVRGLEGSYFSRLGVKVQDRVSLIYTDTPFAFEDHFRLVSQYTDELRAAAFAALDEETVLVVALKVYHAEDISETHLRIHRGSGTQE